MKQDRNILFIGHANPEDNEFTLWVRQKLINEGYQSECDITILVGGENDYWKDIQECLEKSTCKYLLVLSKKTFKKSGVLDEWEHIRSIIKKYKIKDFIIPLKIDKMVSYSERIGLNRINIIDFSNSWALGLKQLVKKLDKDLVPKNKSNNQKSVMEWFNNRFGIGQGIEKKKETYYSNWLKIKGLPKKFYLFEYANDKQAEFINSKVKCPNIVHDKYVITFEKEINPQILIDDSLFNKEESLIKYKSKKEISINDIKNNSALKSFPTLQDSKNFLIRLLKDTFDKYLINKNLKTYTYTGSKLKCYYYEKNNSEDDLPNPENNSLDTKPYIKVDKAAPYKVSFSYQGKKKRKILIGEYFESFWHLGISLRVVLFPTYAYEIKTHIVFSDDGINVWDDEDKLHAARRKKGKRFFNEEWRDLLFAFLFSLTENSEYINLPISETHALQLSPIPLSFTSSIGYKEPSSKARLVPINEFLEDEYNDDKEEDIQTYIMEKVVNETSQIP